MCFVSLFLALQVQIVGGLADMMGHFSSLLFVLWKLGFYAVLLVCVFLVEIGFYYIFCVCISWVLC
jgi:hypothetical protein